MKFETLNKMERESMQKFLYISVSTFPVRLLQKFIRYDASNKIKFALIFQHGLGTVFCFDRIVYFWMQIRNLISKA